MTERKFTDEEVIKALECHADLDVSCYGRCKYANEMRCGSKMAKDALALINRQKAEIERLQVELDDLKRDAIPKLQGSLRRANDMGRDLEVKFEAMRCAANYYWKKVLEKEDTARHYAPGAEVVTVEVPEHYARELQEGSHETD